MEGHPEEDGVRVDVSAGIFPEREADGQPAALSKESAPAPMKENAMPAAHDDLIQEDSFISESRKSWVPECYRAFYLLYITNNNSYIVALVEQDIFTQS